MAKTNYESVDHYIASQPEAVQGVLEKVRRAIRKAVPDGEEVISYQIPAIKVDGGAAVYFAGWKNHYSLYPTTAGVLSAFKDELAGYELSKGTIRFPLDEPVPVKLIAAIAKLRAKEVTDSRKSKAATDKKPRQSKAASRPGSQVGSKLTRALNPMPETIRTALAKRGLKAAYEARPDYQRNDYLGWIAQAKRDDTSQKRLDQMLDELEQGDVYMNMAWRG